MSGLRPFLTANLFYQTETSCAVDALNIGIGEFTFRADCITGNVGVNFGSNKDIQSLMSRIKLSLRRLPAKDIDGNWPSAPTLLQIFQQPSGVYIVEIFWKRTDSSDFHVITINADRRYVACNTLGVVPLGRNGMETAALHASIAALWCVRSISRVYVIVERL